jgi:pimeloyl-ACP methyl ester carboxylesterase
MGQPTDLIKSEEMCYEWLHGELIKANDTIGLKLVEETHYADRNLIVKYGGIFKSSVDVNRIMGSSPYFSEDYIQLYQKGLNFSLECLFSSTVMNINLFNDINKLDIPVYFMQGKFDRILGPELLVKFNDKIEAPYKEIIWFENSGHFPNFDEPVNFQNALIEIKNSVLSRD